MNTATTIGARLKDERRRLGMSQTEFASLAAVVYKTQGMYERGERMPDAAYLAAVAASGVDVLYVITGRREKAA